MSFGFSVGDFIAVGELIAQVVSSLRGVGSEYQELLRELESLSCALQHLDKLQTHSNSTKTLDSIKCAALLCRHPLEKFLQKINKYEESLGYRTAGGLKAAVKKVEW